MLKEKTHVFSLHLLFGWGRLVSTVDFRRGLAIEEVS